MVTIEKNDFVSVEFTGRIKDTGEVFDTNIEKDAKDADMSIKDIKPFVLSVGHKMLPDGFDEDLVGKEVGKQYVVVLKPQKAFGLRDPQRIRMIPTKVFHQQKIDPQRGMQLSLDGQLAKILSNSGGRTLVDFNNPLAGKEVEYTYTILSKVDKVEEKVDALQEFLFRKTFDVDIKDKKAVFKVEKEMEPMIKIFAPKFKEILDMEVGAEVVEKKKGEKNPAHGHEGHVHGPDCEHQH